MTEPDLTLVTPTRLTLLDTAHWLIDEGRAIVAVDQLSDSHRRNLLAWLRARAAHLAQDQDGFDYRLYLLGVLSADRYIARQRDRRAVPPEMWLEETPLVRRLVALTTADQAPQPPRRRRFLPPRLRGRR